MAVDASKLRKLGGRRGLGVPPIDGSPGIEESDRPETSALASSTLLPNFREHQVETEAAELQHTVLSAAESLFPPHNPSPLLDGSVKAASASEPNVTAPSGLVSAAAERGNGGQTVFERRQRVPPLEAEPKIPFTTRVSASTKDRLENACHFLRKKHQDFINDAIIAHLKKHGF